jgi:hypothetical protein
MDLSTLLSRVAQEGPISSLSMWPKHVGGGLRQSPPSGQSTVRLLDPFEIKSWWTWPQIYAWSSTVTNPEELLTAAFAPKRPGFLRIGWYMKTLTLDTELAWSAGFLDGEGNYGMQVARREKRKDQYTFRIQAAQVHREPLDRLQLALGGRVTGPHGPYKTTKQAYYSWAITGYNEAKEALFKLLPFHSSIKAEQGLKAWSDLLEMQAQRNGI